MFEAAREVYTRVEATEDQQILYKKVISYYYSFLPACMPDELYAPFPREIPLNGNRQATVLFKRSLSMIFCVQNNGSKVDFQESQSSENAIARRFLMPREKAKSIASKYAVNTANNDGPKLGGGSGSIAKTKKANNHNAKQSGGQSSGTRGPFVPKTEREKKIEKERISANEKQLRKKNKAIRRNEELLGLDRLYCGCKFGLAPPHFEERHNNGVGWKRMLSVSVFQMRTLFGRKINLIYARLVVVLF